MLWTILKAASHQGASQAGTTRVQHAYPHSFLDGFAPVVALSE